MTDEEIKQAYLDRYDAIVGPKNLTKEQEINLINYLIWVGRWRMVPCIEGHKHTDSATRYDETSPWVCLSCGKEFPRQELMGAVRQ
jgi:hypothetical protein